MEIPLSRSLSEDSAKGKIVYSKGILKDASVQGIFAFSFYLRSPDDATLKNVYLQGITLYLDAIERPDSVFANWKIVLYTDAFTASLIQDPALRIGPSPHVELAVVNWPYYEAEDGKVNGDVLRCMRLRAFFEFPTLPVFMRDADTLWAITDYYTSEKTMNYGANHLYEWESTFWQYAKELPSTFVVGTSLGYKMKWHHNKRGKRYAPLGAFAGFQSATAGVPCFQTEDLWDKAVLYILSRSTRTDSGYSNEEDPMRVGKDEQILTFLFIPACIDSIFFFEVDMYHRRRFETRHVPYYDTRYPAVIFKRGSNANLKRLFLEGIHTEFKRNLANLQESIFEKDKQREKDRNSKIEATLKTLGNTTELLGTSTYGLNLYAGSQLYATTKIKDALSTENTDKALSALYDAYVKAERAFEQGRYAFIKEARRQNNSFNEGEALANLRRLLDQKYAALRGFLTKALALAPRADLEARLRKQLMSINEITRLLDWYEGKVPVASAPPAKAASSLAGLFKKGGTRKKTKRTKKTKRAKRL